MKSILMLLFFACLFSSPSKASFTTDDRYFDTRSQAAPQQVRKVARHRARYHRARNSVTKTVLGSRLKYRRVAWQRHPMSLPQPVVLGGRPAGAPRAWCGFWLGRQLGMLSRSLWLARNWVTVGTHLARPAPGAIVVWRHHVGRITAVRADGAIRVLSGNDGRAIRDRWRSARGVIAYRAL